jgi:cellulose synthase/poly-beta-1,6-N-acetylglucosamine synthase-like glycosyltransferase
MNVVWAMLFWTAVAGVIYAYAGYPLLLALASATRKRVKPAALEALPSISLIVPAHNEEHAIQAKIRNCALLRYPPDQLEILYVSDGSTDGTAELIRTGLDARSRLIELPARRGKAAALNAGLEQAAHEIVVFTDASMRLEEDALEAIVQPFRVTEVGCVSGEDVVAGAGGEALYGRYELFLRRRESRLHSIAGASGSFYAERRSLSRPFQANLAPDFSSVLRAVESGYRAVSEPTARGSLKALVAPADEFRRKVRTLLRGMTTIGHYSHLLNPVKYGWFAWILLSHKIARWLVPLFMLVALLTSLWLAAGSVFFAAAALLQGILYGAASVAIGRCDGRHGFLPLRIAVFAVASNAAVAVAWWKYLTGVRQELWAPSRR